MSAKLEIKESSRISIDKNGFRVERVAHVSDVSGNNDAQLYRAITDSDLPRVGDPHPVVPNVTVQTLTASPLGGGRYRVVIVYARDTDATGGSDESTVRVSGNTTLEEVKTDASGARLVTYYVSGNSFFTKRFTAEIEKPRLIYDFSYTAKRFPKRELDTYLGKVNSRRWNGYGEKQVLCTGVNVDEQGDDFLVRFTFAINEDTWKYFGVIPRQNVQLNPQLPDPLLNLETGVRPFDVYASVDFTPLGFTV